MTRLDLEHLTWPEIEAEIADGRDTIIMALGATEQHGFHLPLATDSLLGDHLARELGDRLDAFVAPTLRLGCSSHHLDFPGTVSISEETFHALVADVADSLVGAGFGRIVLVPTHGGNFAPLAAAAEKLDGETQEKVIAVTDVSTLLEVARTGEREHGVPLAEGGLHAGEWETSMLLAIHPELASMDRAQPGFVGPLEEGIQGMFAGGVKSISSNGAIGDPSQASSKHGERYWAVAVELAMRQIEQTG
jgi:creatinine amidohydrolase